MKSSIFKFQTTSVTQKTFEREVSPLLQIKDAYPKMVLARIRDEAYQYEGNSNRGYCRLAGRTAVYFPKMKII